MNKRTKMSQLVGDFPRVADLDISSMYAYAPPSPEIAARDKENKTRKTCDIHLKRIADERKEYFSQNGLEETYTHSDAPEVTIISWSAYAGRYQEMLLTECLKAGITLSWDESIGIIDELVANTSDIPGMDADPKEWVANAMKLNKLMKAGVELVVNFLSPRAAK